MAAGPARAEDGVAVRWLGVAGFSISAGDTVLLHDPYFSRPGLLRSLFRRYVPDPEVLEPLLAASGPVPELARAQLVLIGHSHFDHLGDAAWIAQRTSARLAGTATSAAIARGYGLPEASTRVVAAGDRLRAGPFEVRAVASRHARVLAGRVPFPGEVTEPPEAPIHAISFKMGGALGYLVTHAPSGVRLFVLSSAAIEPAAVAALGAEVAPLDVLLPAIQGRDAEMASQLVSALRPRIVVPHHYDDFFQPLAAPDAAAPGDPEDLEAFEAELEAAAAEAGVALELRRLGLFERLEIAPAP